MFNKFLTAGDATISPNAAASCLTLLMDLLISYFETSKYEKIILEVRESNTSAQSLYKKYNFKYLGKRKKYYVTEDADIFIKEKVYAE